MSKYIDIVFDGPPSHESGRFVEVEDDSGTSIKFGEWVERPDGYWVLRIPSTTELEARIEAIRGLPEKWRNTDATMIDAEHCLHDLEEALEGE